MKFLRNILDAQHKHFVGEGKLVKLYPLYEALDTFAFTPGETSTGSVQVRDGIDLKRAMVTVAVALLPCVLMAMYNTGYQAHLASEGMGLADFGWRGAIMSSLGVTQSSTSLLSNIFLGALYFIPIFLVTNIAGGFWELLFSSIRGHEINEGFLVTGILLPLTLPATIPLWQVVLGVSFGVVVGKEIFGGTGKNFLNPALTARAFLFFAYPAAISGDAVWVAVDGFTGATALGQAASGGMAALTVSWKQAFLGLIPGSMGETSTLACLLGAALLLVTKIASWRIMLSTLLSAGICVLILNQIGSGTNAMFGLTPAWHLVLGGFAFGLVFMATDPVSGAMTFTGQYAYGALIGFMIILVRVVNPAYPEGTMLAILFANCFAPLIDWFVVNANVKRRLARA